MKVSQKMEHVSKSDARPFIAETARRLFNVFAGENAAPRVPVLRTWPACPATY
jgi:hypothetical protein